MQDASDVVDAYLAHHHRVGLEEVLAEGTRGFLPIVLADVARISAECLESYRHDDGALSETYRGLFTLNGAEYRFKCVIYTDVDGARYVIDVQEFVAVQWTAQVHVIGCSR
jgi:hypothetical protein